jgi:hypothetical protein
MQSKRTTLSEYLAERIINNQMRVRFSHAHADFLEEQSNMSNEALNQNASKSAPAIEAATTNLRKPTGSTTTSGMNVTSSVAPISVKTGTGVKTIEGSFPGDHRAPANKADITASFKNQAGPRGETTTTELEGA